MKIKSFISKPSFWIPLFILVVFLMFFVSSGRKENFRRRQSSGQIIGGSWSESCTKIDQNDGTLNARCKDRGGSYKSTSINVAACNNGWKARNDNGQLKCD